METNIIILAEDNLKGQFYLKKFKNVEKAIKYGKQITRQYKGYIISYIKEKKTNHRWDIIVFRYTKKDAAYSFLTVSSKKSAKLVVEKLKEYDNALKIYINKFY